MRNRLAGLAVILVLAFPVAALAGANQGATMLAGCGNMTKMLPASCTTLRAMVWCEDMFPSVNTQEAPLLSWVAILVGRHPAHPLTSLSGVDFGVYYDPNALYNATWTHCGSLEVNGTAPPWPQPGSGNTVVWTTPQSGVTVLVGYFTVAKYAGYPPSGYEFIVGAHPLYGVARAVDGASNFDDLRVPAIANLAGGLGSPDCGTAVEATSWGRVKSLYGR